MSDGQYFRLDFLEPSAREAQRTSSENSYIREYTAASAADAASGLASFSSSMSALTAFSQQQKKKSSFGFGNPFGGHTGGDLESGGSNDPIDGTPGFGGNFFHNTVGKLFGGEGGNTSGCAPTSSSSSSGSSKNAGGGYLHAYMPVGGSGVGGSFVEKLSSAGSSVRTSIESLAPPSAERMQCFGILLLTGLLCLSLSFAFLPMLVVAPHKFALMFSVGSASIFGAQVTLRGLGPFLAFAFASERIAFSTCYILAWFGVLYNSLVYKSYILTLLCIIAQLTSMAYVLVSYVPGGTRFLNVLFGIFWGTLKMCFRTCCGGSSGGGGGGLLG